MGHPTIKVGSKGSSVELCQQLLTKKGFPLTADGSFGPATEAKVIGFQKREGLTSDGVVGPNTWAALEKEDIEIDLPIDFARIASFFPEMFPQKYRLSKAECPSNPPGMSLKRIGDDWTNCVLFTSWILSKAFEGVSFTKDQWSRWMVSTDSKMIGNPPIVPNWGPKVAIEWGVATSSPGKGVHLVQSFSGSSGHSFIVVDHCDITDKILTLESVGSHDGAGWMQIGPLREVLNPGPDWRDKVTQTWGSRFGRFDAFHISRLHVDPKSVQEWLERGA
jgi:hypothetical protein